jgi:signal transduction histidine kinase
MCDDTADAALPLQLALSAAKAGTWCWHVQSDQVLMDTRGHALFGLPPTPPAPLQGWISRLVPEDGAQVIARIEQIRTQVGDDEWDIAFRARHVDGSLRWMQGLGRAQRDDAGRMTALMGILLDVHEHKCAEIELRSTRDALRRRARVRGEALRRRDEQLARLATELTLVEQQQRERLAAVLHDELQQLLIGAQCGLEELLQRGEPATRQGVEQRLADLVARALAVSRTLVAELNPAVLQEPRLLDMLQWLARWMRDAHGLSVQVSVAPNCVLERDDLRALLFLSVREALVNVVKHAGVKEAELSAEVQGSRLVVEVVDHGKGFSAAADHARVAHLDGHFGLASIHERVRLVGGAFALASQPGQGTRLTIEVPLDAAFSVAYPALLPVRALPPGAVQRPVRVLLGDSRPLARQALAALLRGVAEIDLVGEAGSGPELMTLAQALKPDAVVLALSLHGLGSVQTARRLHGQWPTLRIVALSDDARAGEADAMLRVGALVLLPGAADLSALLRAICGLGLAG